MNAQLRTRAKAHVESSFMPAPSGLLQRKCACGQHAYGEGDYAECNKKRQLQRKLTVGASNDPLEQGETDRIANQVLAAPADSVVGGTPLRIQRFSRQSNGQMDATPASVYHALASPGRQLNPALPAGYGATLSAAISARCQSHTTTSAKICPKLIVNTPGDIYEPGNGHGSPIRCWRRRQSSHPQRIPAYSARFFQGNRLGRWLRHPPA